jgi:DNA-binding NarL/FixJ family response regulator
LDRRSDALTVLVVDDHAVFADALSAALEMLPEVALVSTANTLADAITTAAQIQPDVALVDMFLPDADGADVVERLRQESPATRVVVLTASHDVDHFTTAMAAGAAGYLVKQAKFPEVASAVIAANDGRVIVPKHVTDGLLAAAPPARGLGSDLTARELDVLVLLGQGYDARNAAAVLGITWNTCRGYVKNVRTKLGCHSAAEAVHVATRLGMI